MTLSLLEVMWDNLSFVFQALWGHLGQWLFEDRGGPSWGHPEIHPQEFGWLYDYTGYLILQIPAAQQSSFLKDSTSRENMWLQCLIIRTIYNFVYAVW